MKMVIAIVQDYDSDRLLKAISAAGLFATRLSSTGGFLRSGNKTVFLGVDDDRVPQCLKLIEHACRNRAAVELDPTSAEFAEWLPAGVHDVNVGGAVVFILAVARFEKFELPQESP